MKKADYVSAAVAFVDANGLDAMTMRSLGEHMGVDPTAVYRHFPTKEDLTNAMADWFFGLIVQELSIPAADPRSRIFAMGLATRKVFSGHPGIGVAALHSTGNSANGLVLTRSVADDLLELGVPADFVPVAYQALEGFAFGACMMDFIGSPANWEVRRMRYRALELDPFDAAGKSVSTARDTGQRAFETGLATLLDAFISRRA